MEDYDSERCELYLAKINIKAMELYKINPFGELSLLTKGINKVKDAIIIENYIARENKINLENERVPKILLIKTNFKFLKYTPISGCILSSFYFLDLPGIDNKEFPFIANEINNKFTKYMKRRNKNQNNFRNFYDSLPPESKQNSFLQQLFPFCYKPIIFFSKDSPIDTTNNEQMIFSIFYQYKLIDEDVFAFFNKALFIFTKNDVEDIGSELNLDKRNKMIRKLFNFYSSDKSDDVGVLSRNSSYKSLVKLG